MLDLMGRNEPLLLSANRGGTPFRNPVDLPISISSLALSLYLVLSLPPNLDERCFVLGLSLFIGIIAGAGRFPRSVTSVIFRLSDFFLLLLPPCA